MEIYDIEIKDINGENISLEKYRGKIMLIVNTATGCGFTPQYKDLEELYNNYKEREFEILDFPSNQFLNQAPGTNEEIKTFCELNYGVSFNQFSKIDVNGKNESPLFTFLKKEQGGFLNKDIKWNFTKFLIDRNGRVIKRYSPNTNPKDITQDIEKLL